jgi:FkbM family methyltransferase
MIRHWLTICALIVVTHGHFRMESDTSDQKHTVNINSPTFVPNERNRSNSSTEVTASVGVTGQIVIEDPAKLRSNNLENTTRHRRVRYSQVRQDQWVLKQISSDPTIPKIFLDVGAHDGVVMSNTQMLEEHGWSGHCIDPVPRNFGNRKCKVIEKAVAGTHRPDRLFDDCRHGGTPGHDGFHDTLKPGKKNNGCSKIKVEQITPAQLLKEVGSPRELGYISLDIEGAEFEFLEGFQWDKTCARLWTIEANGEPAQVQKVKDGLLQHGCSEDDDPSLDSLDAFFKCKCIS